MLIDMTGRDTSATSTTPQVAQALQSAELTLSISPGNTFGSDNDINLSPNSTSPENPKQIKNKKNTLLAVSAIAILLAIITLKEN
jgi:hypothetical protein